MSRAALFVAGTAAFAAAAFLLLAVAHSTRWEVYLAAAILGVGIGLHPAPFVAIAGAEHNEGGDQDAMGAHGFSG